MRSRHSQHNPGERNAGGALGVPVREEALVLRFRGVYLIANQPDTTPIAPARVCCRCSRTGRRRRPSRRPGSSGTASARSCESYVAEVKPVPPLPVDELREHADRDRRRAGLDPKYRDYVGVLLNNEVWRDTLAGVPYERRLLLLPKCLRVEAKCPAPFDEFGLLCKQCGLCSIQDLQDEAERLGYAVLVAEGSAIVMSIIQTGKIEAIVGVSCLSVLERAFPYMEAAAIPGVAIPLLQDDCIDTTVDIDWVWDFIHLTSDDRTHRLDLDAHPRRSRLLVHAQPLDALIGPGAGRDRADRPRVAAPRRQALAAVPDRVRLPGAAAGSRRAVPGRR